MDNLGHQHTRMVTHGYGNHNIITPSSTGCTTTINGSQSSNNDFATNFTRAGFQSTPARSRTPTTRQQSPHVAVQPFIKTDINDASATTQATESGGVYTTPIGFAARTATNISQFTLAAANSTSFGHAPRTSYFDNAPTVAASNFITSTTSITNNSNLTQATSTILDCQKKCQCKIVKVL